MTAHRLGKTLNQSPKGAGPRQLTKELPSLVTNMPLPLPQLRRAGERDVKGISNVHGIQAILRYLLCFGKYLDPRNPEIGRIYMQFLCGFR